METTPMPDNKVISYDAYPAEGDFVLSIAPRNIAPFWIMLGTPFEHPVFADDVRFRNVEKRGDVWLDWVEAYSEGNPTLRIVESSALGWDNATQGFVSLTHTQWPIGTKHQFDPWWGYWMMARDTNE